MFTTLVKRNPFTTYAVIGLVLWVTKTLAGIHYDATGAAYVLWWLAQWFAIPYFATGYILYDLAGTDGAIHMVLTFSLGLGLCALLDLCLRRFIFDRRRV